MASCLGGGRGGTMPRLFKVWVGDAGERGKGEGGRGRGTKF